MNNAFLKSFEVLSSVYNDKAFSTIALNKVLNNCVAKDKSLITKIVYGVLDNDIRLTYIISKNVKKLPKNKDAFLCLKIGTYCLADLSLPQYMVCNDIAELSKITEDKHIVGFVNATLKNIAKVAKDFDDYPSDPILYISTKYSYPEWAFRKLVKDYGFDKAKQIVEYKLDEKTTIRIKNCDKLYLENHFKIVENTSFDDAFFVSGGVIEQNDCYTAQSLSSMAVARICANEIGRNFLDCCAAPGGKSVYVAQLCPQTKVVSCDIYEHRVNLIDLYAKRMGVKVESHCLDMSVLHNEFLNKFDTVLCDVPCSGFGVLNNRPDIKLFRENKDISDLMKLQYSILDACSNYVNVGGRLVYSTCTVFDNENGQNIRKFLKNHPEFEFYKINLPMLPNVDGKPFYQFLPSVDNLQGFFVAVLKKIR